jgi:hypothetical protein
MTSPAAQVAGFIAKFDPAIARLASTARTMLRKRMPTATELVYDSYNALAIGFGPSTRTSEAIVSLAIYARGVNLYFLYGAHLTDPDRLLEGNGTRGPIRTIVNSVSAKQRPRRPPARRTLRRG